MFPFRFLDELLSPGVLRPGLGFKDGPKRCEKLEKPRSPVTSVGPDLEDAVVHEGKRLTVLELADLKIILDPRWKKPTSESSGEPSEIWALST